MMHMSFWFGTDLGTFLFDGLNVKTISAFFGTCLGLIAIAIIYEAMKTLQIKLHQLTKASLSTSESQTNEKSSLLSQFVPKFPRFSSSSQWWGIILWILEVLHYSAQTTLGYIIMLVVMSYNTYICIALIIGSAIGYWTFSPILLYFNLRELKHKNKNISCSPGCSDSISTIERRPSTVSDVAEQLASEISAEIHIVADT
ncbi:probable low affinity copper uptake protein 2 [Microplitis demolitor]|uniref:probable low affinity copper uptake protein 2 n=1 Tax=Microplitis demolitor TaxID=69319 RepID=UPI0004CD2203|nr:probable low affinity copper uptake protein 2 [Microplitis demolitor]XP_008560502.1 probable low affinity copper uptake protein 2 [Microplitis demolitor]XP_008560503.1 probable low affinity copper uptake protein 2 [Microplitis demolitor]